MRQVKSLVLDLILIALATLLALALRDNLEYSPTRFWALVPYLAMTLIITCFVFPAMSLNKTLWRYSGPSEYWRLVSACLIIVLAAVAVGFGSNRLDNFSRTIPILQFLLMVALLVGARLGMRAHRFRHNVRNVMPPLRGGATAESVIVVGLNTVAELFLQAASEVGKGRMAIEGVIGRTERQTGQLFRSYPILGVPEELESILKDLEVHGVSIDRIVVTIAFDQLSDTARQALLDVENGSRIRVDFFAERLGLDGQKSTSIAERMRSESTDDESTSGFVMPEESRQLREALRRPYWQLKRTIDIVVSAVLIIVALPFLIAIGMITALTIGIPVLFWQQRPGLEGRPFRVYKFRSLLGAHDEHGMRLPDELRQTPFGRFLRLSRLDELPQLFNILLGHMTIVGPRPLLDVDQLEQFRDRLLVRPGLTGWAQVNGGKSISATDKMALDMWYIRNASLALDLRIVLLTVKMVLLGEQENPMAVERAWSELQGKR